MTRTGKFLFLDTQLHSSLTKVRNTSLERQRMPLSIWLRRVRAGGLSKSFSSKPMNQDRLIKARVRARSLLPKCMRLPRRSSCSSGRHGFRNVETGLIDHLSIEGFSPASHRIRSSQVVSLQAQTWRWGKHHASWHARARAASPLHCQRPGSR